MEKVCVLGAGSWGSALALVLASKEYDVSLWTLSESQCKEINEKSTNENYLKNIVFPKNIVCTTSLEESVKYSSVVVLATPSQAIRNICKNIKTYIRKNQIIVNVAKGL